MTRNSKPNLGRTSIHPSNPERLDQFIPSFLATHYKREGFRGRVRARASRSHSLLICSLSVRYVRASVPGARGLSPTFPGPGISHCFVELKVFSSTEAAGRKVPR